VKSFLNFVSENTGLQKQQTGFGATDVELAGERAKAAAVLAARGEKVSTFDGMGDARKDLRTMNRADQEVTQAKLEKQKLMHSGVAAATPTPVMGY
tara:strand:+ start:445 stop:732 length:288 start_codon:yes stop_codon:yes gene_type:complete